MTQISSIDDGVDNGRAKTGIGKTGVHFCYYTSSEFRELSPAQVAKLKEQCAANKGPHSGSGGGSRVGGDGGGNRGCGGDDGGRGRGSGGGGGRADGNNTTRRQIRQQQALQVASVSHQVLQMLIGTGPNAEDTSRDDVKHYFMSLFDNACKGG